MRPAARQSQPSRARSVADLMVLMAAAQQRPAAEKAAPPRRFRLPFGLGHRKSAAPEHTPR